MPKVNQKILIWARESAGMTVDDAVMKLGIHDSHGLSAKEKLMALEKGKIEPTRNMLVKMGKQYRRPLLTFYMSAPPKKGDRGKDFRTLPSDYSKLDDFLIDTLIRDVQARQSLIRSAMEDDEEVEPLNYIGSISIKDDLQKVLNVINDILKFNIDEFRKKSNVSEAFAALRNHVQKAGIYVLLIGNLGSHHTSIDVDIFRGFALADNLAPFIIINDQDSHSAWSFTLIHEFVHLLLGQTGISGGRPEKAIEAFCDRVAGEYLLPSEELNKLTIDKSSSFDDKILLISQFAKDRNISSSMVSYRLYQTNRIEFDVWFSLHNLFRRLWLDERTKLKKIARSKNSGPSYYVIKKHRLGTPFIKLVRNMMDTGSLPTSKAGKVLGIKPKNIQSLFDTIFTVA